ncbi:uncharacterized protein BYT42DRAFT_578100 [Radiomyces spectabilis]|uniref:uncharacterized protein n=1 Tax=Radiomyces spectabilis TaxID=64574 RepID=UPI00221F8DC3|nr:uncharacterized protein BYT42DRAFT_578100 [Radiomyces spectabilis]KAI8372811.1 hypothetical protein BYT42DRAFT_578100 [Radiomyces spectabilis]
MRQISSFYTMLKSYLHRFYPWQALKLLSKSTRNPHPCIPEPQQLAENAVKQVESILTAVYHSHAVKEDPNICLKKSLGHQLQISPSSIQGAGMGVFLKGSCKKGSIVCFYPGTIYLPSEPLLFASIANRYILKCYDGVFVDAKPTGLSGRIHKSIYHRENWPGAIQISDATWMTKTPRNPLAVGHIVNNGTTEYQPNVFYHEIDIPPVFPRDLRQYIPNIYWSSIDPLTTTTRMVGLIATRDIHNEELFSVYMDTV